MVRPTNFDLSPPNLIEYELLQCLVLCPTDVTTNDDTGDNALNYTPEPLLFSNLGLMPTQRLRRSHALTVQMIQVRRTRPLMKHQLGE